VLILLESFKTLCQACLKTFLAGHDKACLTVFYRLKSKSALKTVKNALAVNP